MQIPYFHWARSQIWGHSWLCLPSFHTIYGLLVNHWNNPSEHILNFTTSHQPYYTMELQFSIKSNLDYFHIFQTSFSICTFVHILPTASRERILITESDPATLILKTLQRLFIPIRLKVNNALVCLRCYNRNINWVACKQHKFISHSSGSWKFPNQVIARFSLWWEHTSSKPLSSHGRSRGTSPGALHESTDPPHKGSTVMTWPPPQVHTPHYHHTGA